MIDQARLGAIALFAQLTPDELRRLAENAVEETYETGRTLVREGDFSTDLYVIEDGSADVVRQGETVGTLGPGDVVGEIGVIEKQQRTADVLTTLPTRVIRVNHWEVKRLAVSSRRRIAELAQQRREQDRLRD